jgi:hypothetical protein
MRELESEVIDYGGTATSPLKDVKKAVLFLESSLDAGEWAPSVSNLYLSLTPSCSLEASGQPEMHVHELDEDSKEPLFDEKTHRHHHSW